MQLSKLKLLFPEALFQYDLYVETYFMYHDSEIISNLLLNS